MQRSPYRHSKNSNFMTKRKEANRTMATSFANKCFEGARDKPVIFCV
jgi:hypothetical protein